MKAIPTALPEVLILEPRVFADERGFFFESYNKQTLDAATGLDLHFVQDNHSQSRKNVLRGLHYQRHRPQGKLVRVIKGEIFDVAVDLRRGSPRFGQWTSVVLSESNRRQLWVPEGFAHGILVTSESAELLYKTTEFYVPGDERTIMWDDPTLAIAWPVTGAPILSPKDHAGGAFARADVFP